LLDTPQLLVVYKPAGLSFHADQEGELGCVEAVREAQESGALPPGRLWGVHRLDRVTSGALVFAKSREAAGIVGGFFRDGAVEKLYIALSSRRPSKSQGEVVGDMAPSRRGAYKLLRSREDPARTRFTSSGVVGGRPGLRGFVLRPRTGRTHQLRVAMKALGAPVLGDALYADAGAAAQEERAYLHAAGLYIPPLAAGEPATRLLVPPEEGEEFLTESFKLWFSRQCSVDMLAPDVRTEST